ncbi:zinc ABC transporter substrate-binding protein AztC [Glycomyces algeriensis]|uniref:ABC transporter substrate-binding protein n=1 Tax=Glycomyces algeriensis TaxID=256037 RepID=A0A9W6LIJ1_9ACTN|nr:zinc ABC transporter substrate-binding protein AztC [Glycomyces algeriensis]MDA1365549.1 zinc ABC transporter substrate-binding protein AztC [Glycomyces algeriensis]MDR7351236.1 zinc/manganese transport system substrate-binding protein [Glycomyces algeriensis]GLI43949.1 ABC transporter substrate-binding protein [Glycomyces algeriensis]
MVGPTGRALAALTLVAAAALSGCAAFESERSGIVVTTNLLGDITRSIVGDEAEVTVLMGANADPHSFGVSAQQAASLEQAELLVHNGLGLEEGVLGHVEAAVASGVPDLAVGEHVDPIDYTADESAGEPDPHFWTDPVRVSDAVDVIADKVIEQVPGVDAEQVRANADAYRAQVDDLHADATELFARIPPEHRKLVTNHHVFGYLAQRYDFAIIGAVIPSGTTLASPSGSDLKDLADAVAESGVPVVFADSSQPDRLVQAMAEEAGVDIEVVPLFTESLTEPGEGAGTYLEMTRSNAEAIAAGLGAE